MLGFSELQLLFLPIVVVFFAEWWRLRQAGPNLVLKEFRIDPTKDTGELIYISGRRGGFFSWFLGLFGLHPQTSFSVTSDEIARETAGPSGFDSQYATLANVSASRCSYYRAFGILALSFGCFAFGLFSVVIAAARSNDYERQAALRQASYWLWICLLLGSLCYLFYALSKRVIISVTSNGGDKLGISIKRSLIENVSVELKRAMEAVDLINARLLARSRER